MNVNSDDYKVCLSEKNKNTISVSEDEDPFVNVEKVLKTPEYSDVLDLLNKNGNRIVKPYNSDLNHAWYLVGVVYYKQSKFDRALLSFKRSYHHWKEDITAIRAIGTCYSELGNPKLAKYYFIKAINIGGGEYKDLNILIYNLGNTFFDMHKYDLAIEEYKKIKKSDWKTYQLGRKNIKHAQKKKTKKSRGVRPNPKK